MLQDPSGSPRWPWWRVGSRQDSLVAVPTLVWTWHVQAFCSGKDSAYNFSQSLQDLVLKPWAPGRQDILPGPQGCKGLGVCRPLCRRAGWHAQGWMGSGEGRWGSVGAASNSRTTVFPGMQREIGCLKLENGGNFGILSSCIQPCSNSFQREQLSLEPALWDVSGPGRSWEGVHPTWPPCLRIVVPAGGRGRSTALVAGLSGEDKRLLCEPASWLEWPWASWLGPASALPPQPLVTGRHTCWGLWVAWPAHVPHDSCHPPHCLLNSVISSSACLDM